MTANAALDQGWLFREYGHDLREMLIAYVDHGYMGNAPAQAAQEQGITLEVVKLPQAKKGFVLLPRRWVVERSLAWATRFRRLVKGYEALDQRQ